MGDNVPMTTRTSTKTNGKTHRNGERSPRQDREGDAKAARVDAPEKDDVVGSRPTARIGNLSSDLETTPTTTAAAATESDDEEEGVADEEEVRLAVAGMGGGTGAPKRDSKLRAIVQSLERVDAAQGKDRSLLRNFRYEIARSSMTLLKRLDRVFGSEIEVDLRITSPFQRVAETIYTNRAPDEESDVHVSRSIEKLNEAVKDLRKEIDMINKGEHERAAEKRREDDLHGEIERKL